MPEQAVKDLPWSYTAGLFRSVRFGTSDAHGLGVAIQTNYLLRKGALEVTADGRFRPVPAKFPAAIRALAHDLLMVEATGSYGGARELVQRYGTLPPAVDAVLSSLDGIPVDVEPVFGLERLGG